MDVVRSTITVPSSKTGTAIAPGQIWRLSTSFYTYLNSYQADPKSACAQESFWQQADLPEFVMIVKEPTPESPSDSAIVLPLSPKVEFVNDLDLILPPAISGLDREVLVETWHTFSIPTAYLLELAGIRLSQAIYSLIMDVGDSYYGEARLPNAKTIRACGLKTTIVAANDRQRQVEQFREREERWSDLFKIAPDDHAAFLRSSCLIETLRPDEALRKFLDPDSPPRQHQSLWMPLVQDLFGRSPELKTLRQWIIKDHAKVIAISGTGGIGKSALAANLARQVQDHFNYVVWQSLRGAPKLQEIAANIIEFLTGGRESNRSLRDDPKTTTDNLIYYLQTYSCLVIFDNFDAISPDDPDALEHYESYGQLLQTLETTQHQSCVILTSRNEAKAVNERLQLARSFSLKGLKPTAGMQILKAEGLGGTKSELTELSGLYQGNPLALKLATGIIKETFNNEIDEFLPQAIEYREISDSLDRQFSQLPDLEQAVMHWLAIEREAVSVEQLHEDIATLTPKDEVLNALEFLEKRFLIERQIDQFTLQPLVMEWVTQHTVDRIVEELQDQTKRPKLFNSHALVKAQAKDHIQLNQRQQILHPVFKQLLEHYTADQLEARLTQIVETLRETAPLTPGYTAANAIALLRQFKSDLNDSNFSRLAIWQADLQSLDFNRADLSYADLRNSVFTKTLSSILTIAFHPDGQRLATGDKSGNLRVWQVPDGELLSTYKHRGGWIRSVSFSPDGTLLASGGDAQTIKLWSVETGKCLQLLTGHTAPVRAIAFSHDNRRLVSASDDKTVRLWDVSARKCLETLQGHLYRVRAVAFSPDDRKLASAGDDQTIRLWNAQTGEYCKSLLGHTGWVFAIAFSPDGQTIASASGDGTIKLWNVEQGALERTLRAHEKQIRSLIFSPDGEQIISGSEDQTIKLWNAATGELLRTLDQHTSWVRSLAFSANGTLASGSSDHTIKLWNPQEGQCIRTLQGYARRIWSIAVDAQGETLASAGEDAKIRLWQVKTGKYIKSLEGHTDWVRSVQFSPDGTLLASGAHDHTVRLWQVETGQSTVLRGHQYRVRAVCFSPDGQLLATGGHDQTIRLWDVKAAECRATLIGHSGCIRSLSFSPDGRCLISASPDRTIRLWDVESATCQRIIEDQCRFSAVKFDPSGKRFASAGEDLLVRLWDVESGERVRSFSGHRRWVQSIAFNTTGDLLVSGSEDQTARVWNVETGQQIAKLKGHDNWIRSVAFSPDGTLVMSGAEDETVRIWNWKTETPQDICRNPKPYEQMIITGVTGLLDTERSALQRLGAIDADAGG